MYCQPSLLVNINSCLSISYLEDKSLISDFVLNSGRQSPPQFDEEYIMNNIWQLSCVMLKKSNLLFIWCSCHINWLRDTILHSSTIHTLLTYVAFIKYHAFAWTLHLWVSTKLVNLFCVKWCLTTYTAINDLPYPKYTQPERSAPHSD